MKKRTLARLAANIAIYWPQITTAVGGLMVAVKDKYEIRNEDIEYLSRLFLVEAGSNENEWPAIGYVAINRARTNFASRGTTIRSQVDTPSWFGGSGPGYDRIHTGEGLVAYNSELRKKARKKAEKMLANKEENPIGNRMHFVHYSGLQRCSTPGILDSRWMCHKHPDFGYRRVPRWIVSRSEGGNAMYEPIHIERATFA